MPVELRYELENLLLVCGTCHLEIDAPANIEVFTVERLRELKHRHESRISQILAVPPDWGTAVLRMQGDIGDSPVAIDRSVAAAAVLAQGRTAHFPLSHDPTGIEIDLRRLPTPAIGRCEYYETAQKAIDEVFDRRIGPAIADGTINHVSVFALARWPLLVYLGSHLGDKLDSDVYQRHRATESWDWPEDSAETRFASEVVASGVSHSDAVLVLSMSAAVHVCEVPEALQGCRIYRVFPEDDVTPSSDVIDSPAVLKSGERALRSVFADLEQHRKAAKCLHVLGAAPLSACISLGRVRNREIHPSLVLHDRVDGQYLTAMEVN